MQTPVSLLPLSCSAVLGSSDFSVGLRLDTSLVELRIQGTGYSLPFTDGSNHSTEITSTLNKNHVHCLTAALSSKEVKVSTLH
jgi:hypothetical protein